MNLENLVLHILEVKVKAVCTDSNSGKTLANKYGIEYIFSIPKDLIVSLIIDAAIICSLSDSRYGYTIKAIKSEKNIFFEKPLDLSTKKIE